MKIASKSSVSCVGLTLALGVSFFAMGSVARADQPALIVVSGASEKSIEPNILSLNVEVWSKANSAKAAQGLAGQELKRVKGVLENFKVKKEDIQTLNYSVNPEYVYEPKTQQNRIAGFRAVHTLNLILRKTEDSGALIDSLGTENKSTNVGSNINNLQWDTDKKDSLTSAALAEAVKAARNKAEDIAKAAGVKIKGVYKITHSPSTVTTMGAAMPMMKSMMAESAPTEVSAGQVKINVEVQAEYEIQ